MRQRNIKNLEERLAANAAFLIEKPENFKGRWSEVFGNENPIVLEIGCGKGKFIIDHAFAERDVNFIAVEGQSNVVLRALEKAESQQLVNLRIFIGFVHDLHDFFEEGELSGIYLNFSDPWPKARHAKRRLTHRKRLENYKEVLADEGFIEFKTDNDDLFQFTLEEIEEMDCEITEMTRDLHKGEVGRYGQASKKFRTEYEEKFSRQGKNINFVRIIFDRK